MSLRVCGFATLRLCGFSVPWRLCDFAASAFHGGFAALRLQRSMAALRLCGFDAFQGARVYPNPRAMFFFQPLHLVDEQEKNIEKSCFTPVHCFGLTLSVGYLFLPPVQRNVQSSGGVSSVVSFCVLFAL